MQNNGKTEKVIETTFHQIDYILTMVYDNLTLEIILEEKFGAHVWKSIFANTFIENITNKTLLPQKFNNFVELLISSFKENEISSIDLLTQDDLDSLKGQSSTSNRGIQQKNCKRYLILTSVGSIGKAHYPLPLKYEESSDLGIFKKTLHRLKEEIKFLTNDNINISSPCFNSTPEIPNSIKSQISDIKSTSIAEENELLKTKISHLEKSRVGAVELDYIAKENLEFTKEFENVKKENELEILSLKHRLNQTQREINESKTELSRTQSEMGHFSANESEDVKSTIGELINQLGLEKEENSRLASRQNHEINKHLKELDGFKSEERKLKVQIKKLEDELDVTKKRMNIYVYGKSRPSSLSSSKGSLKNNSPSYGISTRKLNIPLGSKRSNSVPVKKPYVPGKLPQNRKPLIPSQQRRPSPYSRSYGPYGANRSKNSQSNSRKDSSKSNSQNRNNPPKSNNYGLKSIPRGVNSGINKNLKKPNAGFISNTVQSQRNLNNKLKNNYNYSKPLAKPSKNEAKKLISNNKFNKLNNQSQKGNKNNSNVFDRLSKYPSNLNFINQSHNLTSKDKNAKEIKKISKKIGIKNELNTYNSEVKLNNFIKEEFKSNNPISGSIIEQLNNKNIDNRLEKLQEIIKKVI